MVFLFTVISPQNKIFKYFPNLIIQKVFYIILLFVIKSNINFVLYTLIFLFQMTQSQIQPRNIQHAKIMQSHVSKNNSTIIRKFVSYKYHLSIFTLNTGRSSKGIAVEDTGIITGLASPRFSSTSYNVGPQKTIPIL